MDICTIKAQGIREALAYAREQMHERKADPSEEVCFIEDYANQVDPEHKNNVISICEVDHHGKSRN